MRALYPCILCMAKTSCAGGQKYQFRCSFASSLPPPTVFLLCYAGKLLDTEQGLVWKPGQRSVMSIFSRRIFLSAVCIKQHHSERYEHFFKRRTFHDSRVTTQLLSPWVKELKILKNNRILKLTTTICLGLSVSSMGRISVCIGAGPVSSLWQPAGPISLEISTYAADWGPGWIGAWPEKSRKARELKWKEFLSSLAESWLNFQCRRKVSMIYPILEELHCFSSIPSIMN